MLRYNCIKVHHDRLNDELSHAAQRQTRALSTAPLATTTAAHGHPHIHMTGSTRRVRWRAHCNVPKSRARPRSSDVHFGTFCAHIGLSRHRNRSTCARPWQPPAVRSPQMVVSLKGVAGLSCHNALETRQEAPCEPSHQGAVRRCNIWAKDARFGGSGTGCQRHFVYYFEAHLPRTLGP